MQLSRRQFLAAASAFAPQVFAQTPNAQSMVPTGFWNQPRYVWLYRPATREEVREVYWADGQLQDTGYRKICWLLRDTRLNQAMFMSPVLLDVLYACNGTLAYHGIPRAIHTTSGARFPSTNARTEGAARDSEHMRGGAHDGYIPGISTEYMARLGLWLSGGGVGFYPEKRFCHWDVGAVRFWRG